MQELQLHAESITPPYTYQAVQTLGDCDYTTVLFQLVEPLRLLAFLLLGTALRVSQVKLPLTRISL